MQVVPVTASYEDVYERIKKTGKVRCLVCAIRDARAHGRRDRLSTLERTETRRPSPTLREEKRDCPSSWQLHQPKQLLQHEHPSTYTGLQFAPCPSSLVRSLWTLYSNHSNMLNLFFLDVHMAHYGCVCPCCFVMRWLICQPCPRPTCSQIAHCLYDLSGVSFSRLYQYARSRVPLYDARSWDPDTP